MPGRRVSGVVAGLVPAIHAVMPEDLFQFEPGQT